MPEVVLLTTSEVAERFRVDTSVVRRWVAKKKLLPTITTPGGHYRFDEAYIDTFTGDGQASA
jgi:excisionase family DNA binding protein